MTTLSNHYSRDSQLNALDRAEALRVDLLHAEALRAAALKAALASIFAGLSALLRRSRGLLSILPSFLASGVLTLIASAVIHWTSAPIEGRIGTLMESWLIAWAIVCPVAYVASVAMRSLATSLASSDEHGLTSTSRSGLGDIAAALAGATARNSFTVLRSLKVKEDLRA
jgi:hypothetical protein